MSEGATRQRLKAWCRLFAGAGAMVFFMFVAAPCMQRWRPIGTVHAFVEEQGIDCTPLFYTDSEEFYRVQRHMDDAARFAPRKLLQGQMP